MNPVRIPVVRISPHAVLPQYLTPGAAGMDLSAAIDAPLVLPAGGYQLVGCGLALALPDGYEAQVRPRSGLASKYGVTVLNAPGTIDSDYRGEVKALLINHGSSAFTVEPGMRIAQLVVAPVVRIEWEGVAALPVSARGAGGFGHTGA